MQQNDRDIRLDKSSGQAPGGNRRGVIRVVALACGLIAANVYYGQPIAADIGRSVGLPASASGLVMTLTQLGYGLGLLVVVPLGDLLENRRLTLCVLVFCAFALAGFAASTEAAPLLASAFAIGLGSVAVQVLVPLAASLASEADRGAVVGNVMGGLMLGVMLSRPASSVIAQTFSWHAVFWISSAAMLAITALLSRILPRREPARREGYADLLRSMGRLATTSIVLRRRAIYHACLFAAFSAFWTTVPLLLMSRFHLRQTGVAVFALAGVAGAVAAPIAGRVADRGHAGSATAVSIGSVAIAFGLAAVDQGTTAWSLILLVASAILLDLGVAAHFVLGQRAIFSLNPDQRGRLNGLYMASFFVSGALGSGVAAAMYASHGWLAICVLGACLASTALVYFSTERIFARTGRRQPERT